MQQEHVPFERVTSLAFSPDNGHLAVACWGGTVLLYHSIKQRLTPANPLHSAVHSASTLSAHPLQSPTARPTPADPPDSLKHPLTPANPLHPPVHSAASPADPVHFPVPPTAPTNQIPTAPAATTRQHASPVHHLCTAEFAAEQTSSTTRVSGIPAVPRSAAVQLGQTSTNTLPSVVSAVPGSAAMRVPGAGERGQTSSDSLIPASWEDILSDNSSPEKLLPAGDGAITQERQGGDVTTPDREPKAPCQSRAGPPGDAPITQGKEGIGMTTARSRDCCSSAVQPLVAGESGGMSSGAFIPASWEDILSDNSSPEKLAPSGNAPITQERQGSDMPTPDQEPIASCQAKASPSAHVQVPNGGEQGSAHLGVIEGSALSDSTSVKEWNKNVPARRTVRREVPDAFSALPPAPSAGTAFVQSRTSAVSSVVRHQPGTPSAASMSAVSASVVEGSDGDHPLSSWTSSVSMVRQSEATVAAAGGVGIEPAAEQENVLRAALRAAAPPHLWLDMPVRHLLG